MEQKFLSLWHNHQLHPEHEQIAHVRQALQQHSLKLHLFLGTLTTLLLLLAIVSCTIMQSPYITLMAIAGLLTLWLVFRYPWLTLLLVLASAGLPSLTVPLPGHTIRPVEIALFLCLLLIFILRPPMRIQLPHILALLFITGAIISFIHVPEISTSTSAPGANKRLYNLIIIFFALFCGTFLSTYIKNFSSFLSLAVLTNIPLYLISLAQAIGVKLPAILVPNQNPAATGDAGRLVGPFNGAAEYGMYLTGPFALALCCWLLGTRRRDRVIGVCMTIATFLAIIGSGTRSALLAATIMFLVAALVTRRIKLLVAPIFTALAIFAAFPNTILDHLTHAHTSTSNRLFLWHMAIKLIASHPIIGIGLEQFHHYYARLIINPSTQLNQHGISVHNQYLEWGLEGGIPWLILGVLFLISIMLICARTYRQAEQAQRLALLTAILATTAALVTSFLDVPFDHVEGGVFLCLLIGLALSCTTGQQHCEIDNTFTFNSAKNDHLQAYGEIYAHSH